MAEIIGENKEVRADADSPRVTKSILRKVLEDNGWELDKGGDDLPNSIKSVLRRVLEDNQLPHP